MDTPKNRTANADKNLKDKEKEAKQQRLAAALRQNLARRKSATRAKPGTEGA